MKNEQTSKSTIAKVTLETVKRREPDWTEIPGFKQAVRTAEPTVQAILDFSRAQAARSGESAGKTVAYQTLVAKAFTVCSALKALSSAEGDSRLFNQVSFCRSDLARGREPEVTNRCQTILDLATANADLLASKYNISANDLTALKSAIEEFRATQPRPRQSRAARATATKELATLFATLDEVLYHQLDGLMEKFRESDLSFYNEYKTSRRIVASPATHETKEAAAAAATLASPSLPKAA